MHEADRSKSDVTPACPMRPQSDHAHAPGLPWGRREELYRAMFEKNNAVKLLIDPADGQIVDANPAACTFYGYSREEFCRLRVADINELGEHYVRDALQSAEQSTRDYFVVPHRLADGTQRIVEIHSGPIVVAGRQLLFAIIHDVTQRHEAEQRLARSEALYRQVIESSGGVPYQVDFRNHKYDFIGEGIEVLVGLPVKDFTLDRYQSLVVQCVVTDTSGPRDVLAYNHAFRRGEIEHFRVDTQIRTPAGELKWLADSSVPVRDADGRVTGAIGILHDITRRKGIEEELRDARDELEQRVAGRTAELTETNCRLIAEIAERQRAEAALAEERDQVRRIIDGAPLIVCGITIDGILLFMNAAGEQITGYREDELLGRDCLHILYPGERYAEIQEAIAAVCAGDARARDLTLTTRDGASRVISWSTIVRHDDGGRPSEVIGFGLDVTARYAADQQLRLLRHAVEQSVDGIAVMGLDGRVQYVNVAWAHMHGYEPDELLGCTLDRFHNPRQLAEEVRPWVDQLFTEGPREGEVGHVRRDGTEFRTWMTTTVVRDERQCPVGLLGIARDITERKRAEQALHESRRREQHLRQRLTRLHDVGMQLVQADTFDDICRLAVELGQRELGFRRLGLWFTEPDRQFARGSFGICEQGRIRDERDRRVPLAEHTPMAQVFAGASDTLVCRDTPLRDDEGRPVGHGDLAVAALWDGQSAIGAIVADNLLQNEPIEDHDIELLRLYAATLGHLCSRKRIDEALRASEQRYREYLDELAHVTRLTTMGELASSLAHELNQPLSAVTNYLSSALRRLRTDGDARREITIDIDAALIQARRAGEFVRYIKDFIRKQEPQVEPLDVNAAIRQAATFVDDLAQRSGVTLTFNLAEHLPPLLADGVQLQQVILNLLRNSIEAVAEIDQPTRQVEITSALLDSKQVRIAVSDNGPGLPDNPGRVFDAFFTTKRGGTGLGLSISRSIIEAHGGQLAAQSNPRGGATFHFTLAATKEQP